MTIKALFCIFVNSVNEFIQETFVDYKSLATELQEAIKQIKNNKQELPTGNFKGQVFVRQLLSRQETELTQAQIASIMGVSTPRVSASLKALEEKKQIERKVDQNDGRKIVVKLTEKGKQKAQEEKEGFMNHLVNVLEKLGEEDAVQLVRIIKRIGEIHKGNTNV